MALSACKIRGLQIRLKPGMILGLLLLSSVAQAQDAHYWTNQYGTRAELLNGVVVGSIKDLSCTYYNPGALPLAKEQSLILTTVSWQIYSISISDVTADGSDLNTLQAGTAPSIFAFRFPFDALKGHNVTFVFLTRQDFKTNFHTKNIDPYGYPSGGDGDVYVAGELMAKTSLSEYWGGLSWAHLLGEKLGIGATWFVAYRGQEGRYQAIDQGAIADSTGSSIALIDDFSYWNVRTLLKLGLTFDYDPLTFGFTVTTPSINLFGKGSVFNNYSFINSDGTPGSVLVSNYQKDLSTNYKSPLSLAAGASYTFGDTEFHCTLEWFNSVDSYEVIDAEPFTGQTTGETYSPEIYTGLKSVFNWGIGVQHTFNERFSIYGSFITDKSALDTERGTRLAFTSWDIYHVTAGTAFSYQGIDITFGLSYGRGSDIINPVEVSTGGDFLNQYLNLIAGGESTYNRFKAIIGLSFNY
jgi:hypothetical protein